MSYRVSLFNYYANESRSHVSFDTENIMLHEVKIDADIEMYAMRMNNGQDFHKMPVFQRLHAYPTLSFSMKHTPK